jgi:hypothetical protein
MFECQFCGEEVPTRTRAQHYRKVVGWEQVRTGGGAHSIALRQEVGQWAHRWCVDFASRTHQERLL